MSEISKLEHNLIIKKIDSETINLQITDNETLMSIVGQFDQNLKYLGKLTTTNIFFRGNSITCKGNKENINIFCEAVKFLINKYFLTKIIEKEDILLSVKKNVDLNDTNIKSQVIDSSKSKEFTKKKTRESFRAKAIDFSKKEKKEVFKNKTFEINEIKGASSKEEAKRNGWWNQ